MGNGFLMTQVRRTNRNLFLTNIIILISAIAFFMYNMNYLYNVFSGPFEVDNNWLESIEPSLEKKNFIEFTSAEVYDTDIHDIVVDNGKTTIKTDYLLVGIGEKFVYVKVPHGFKETRYIGQIMELPSDIDVYNMEGILEKIVSNRGFSDRIEPILIDASGSFKTNGYIMVGVGFALLLMIIWNLSKYVKRNSDSYSHPIYKSLTAYGNSEDVAKSLDDELEHGNVISIEKFIITDNWVICKTRFSISILKIGDLLWLYKRITKRRFSLISWGKIFEVVNNNNRKGSIAFNVRKEKNADRYLEEIHKRAPWIAFGYNDEYKNLWSGNIEQFVGFVEKRKLQILSYSKNTMENSEKTN